jgi:hypothetical protein
MTISYTSRTRDICDERMTLKMIELERELGEGGREGGEGTRREEVMIELLNK